MTLKFLEFYGGYFWCVFFCIEMKFVNYCLPLAIHALVEYINVFFLLALFVFSRLVGRFCWPGWTLNIEDIWNGLS